MKKTNLVILLLVFMVSNLFSSELIDNKFKIKIVQKFKLNYFGNKNTNIEKVNYKYELNGKIDLEKNLMIFNNYSYYKSKKYEWNYLIQNDNQYAQFPRLLYYYPDDEGKWYTLNFTESGYRLSKIAEFPVNESIHFPALLVIDLVKNLANDEISKEDILKNYSANKIDYKEIIKNNKLSSIIITIDDIDYYNEDIKFYVTGKIEISVQFFKLDEEIKEIDENDFIEAFPMVLQEKYDYYNLYIPASYIYFDKF